jgi:hypothetical protein
MFHQDYLFTGATNQGHDGLEAELFRQLLHGENRSIAAGGVRYIGIVYRAWYFALQSPNAQRLQAIEQVSDGSDASGPYGRPMSVLHAFHQKA